MGHGLGVAAEGAFCHEDRGDGAFVYFAGVFGVVLGWLFAVSGESVEQALWDD